MISVVKNQVACRNCGAIVSFEPSDITMGSHCLEILKCPCCNKEVVLPNASIAYSGGKF